MQRRQARAEVSPVRQRTQYSCMSSSMTMALRSLGYDVSEDVVNKVMGAAPMQGAAWENALACANHFGCVSTLRVPATVRQLKAWCDAKIPVMIAWNPEGREWSHASLVYDVTEGLPSTRDSAGVYEDKGPGLYVWVADPNIPHPEKTYRVVHEDTFYGKWYEKWPNYLVRRPACAIQREITEDGRQVLASRTASRESPSAEMRADWEAFVETNQGKRWRRRQWQDVAVEFVKGHRITRSGTYNDHYGDLDMDRVYEVADGLVNYTEGIPRFAARSGDPMRVMASRLASRYLAACGGSCGCEGTCGGCQGGCQNSNTIGLGQL